MDLKIINFVIFVFCAISACRGANILMLSGIPRYVQFLRFFYFYQKIVFSPSHFIFNKALAEGLAVRGHNLTIVSPDVEKKAPQNVHYIHLEEIYAHYYK